MLRTRPKDGEKLLKAIRQCLKPESASGDGESDRNESDGESLTIDYLTAEHVKAIKAQLEACQDESTLDLMAKGFGALATIAPIAQGRFDELASAHTPVEPIAQAA